MTFPLNHLSPNIKWCMNRSLKISLSSTCQVSIERRVLDLESEVMRGLGSIPTGGNILSLDFISRSKASDANIGSGDAIDSNVLRYTVIVF